MNSKRRQLPLEVSSWMEKDLTLRKITANSRLLTNDTRQNIVLSRQFFSNLLTLSVSRYRKIAEHDFNKRIFLRNQSNKADSPLPGPREDQSPTNMSRMTPTRMTPTRMTPTRMQSSKLAGTSLVCPSAQSFLSRTDIRPEASFTRTPQPIPRQTKTAQPLKADPDIMPPINSTTPPLQRPTTRKQMSLERINRLAQPKNLRNRTPANHNLEHVRANLKVDLTTAEDIFGKIESTSDLATLIEKPLEKPKTAADDARFHHLFDVFSDIYSAKKTNARSVRSIVQSNPSLQDEHGQWKSLHSSAITRKAELERHRQALAEKLNTRVDIFLIDVGA